MKKRTRLGLLVLTALLATVGFVGCRKDANLNFVANGGSGEMAAVVAKMGDTVKLPEVTFTKKGYDFVGWAIEEEGRVKFANGAEFSMVEEEFTLYAIWQPSWKTYGSSAIFNMWPVPVPEGGITFPVGEDDSGTATVNRSFYIGETEVSYGLWNMVKVWASANGYTFANAGEMGSDAGGAGMNVQHPVTMINWRDAMIFCNALTEWVNLSLPVDEQKTPVYYSDGSYTSLLKESTNGSYSATPGTQDCPYIKADSNDNTDMANCTANGFRLPTKDEWECAARWQGTTALNSNVVDPLPEGCTAGYYWTKGNSASGASLPVPTDNSWVTLPAGKTWEDLRDATAAVAVYAQWWDGSNWVQDPAVTSTASCGSKAANGLGLYDMIGNVWEWCFDLNGAARVYRGSGLYDDASNCAVGGWLNVSPGGRNGGLGLRVVCLP